MTKKYYYVLYGLAIMAVTGCSSAKLQISTEPSGAKVFVNDVAVGNSPVSVEYSKLPYENVLNVRVQKEEYGTLNTYIEGPKQAGLGQRVMIRIPKAPDETARVNQDVDQILLAHKLAMSRRFGEAMKIAEQLIMDHPTLVSAYVLRGSICFFARNYEEARNSYHHVLDLDASNQEATKMLKYMDDRKMLSAPARAVSGDATSPAIEGANQ